MCQITGIDTLASYCAHLSVSPALEGILYFKWDNKIVYSDQPIDRPLITDTPESLELVATDDDLTTLGDDDADSMHAFTHHTEKPLNPADFTHVLTVADFCTLNAKQPSQASFQKQAAAAVLVIPTELIRRPAVVFYTSSYNFPLTDSALD